jgi:hypothetical protein|tara:strand:+ start:37 stop:276 length:240 start_codon:yes stop_codon:yes gene_type:complete
MPKHNEMNLTNTKYPVKPSKVYDGYVNVWYKDYNTGIIKTDRKHMGVFKAEAVFSALRNYRRRYWWYRVLEWFGLEQII